MKKLTKTLICLQRRRAPTTRRTVKATAAVGERGASQRTESPPRRTFAERRFERGISSYVRVGRTAKRELFAAHSDRLGNKWRRVHATEQLRPEHGIDLAGTNSDDLPTWVHHSLGGTDGSDATRW